MLSIIIPALNERATIARTLGQLEPLRARGAEVIVVDGGSNDSTPEIAAPLADKVIASPPGRGIQMNAGAEAASGDILLFLHADTVLPQDADRLISDALGGRPAWGRFDVRIEGRHWMLPVVAWMMNQRSRWTGIATGDQALFLRTATFVALGGFPPLALMEDIAMSKQLRVVSPPACIAAKASTSGRRWERHGIWRTIGLMWRLRLLVHFGADPQTLARLYRREPD